MYIAVGTCHAFILTGCWQDRGGTQYQLLYVPPDDEQ